MNPTAKDFLRWKAAPKPEPQKQPEPLGIYPHTGFLSANETARERTGRLIEAMAAGYELSHDDYLYFYGQRCKNATWVRRQDKKCQLKSGALKAAIARGTTSILGGFR